jgi:hypothetical protein
VEGLVDSFFRAPTPGQSKYVRGTVVWVPCAFLLEKFVRLTPDHYNPARQEHDFYTARTFSAADVLQRNFDLFHHLPVAAEHLQKSEEFVVQRHKLRKAVIYSTAIETPTLRPEDARRLRIWFQGCFLVLPIYTLETDQKQPKYPARFVERVKAYAYPHLFHLPRAESFGMRQSVIRFDRAQVVPKDFMRAGDAELSDDATIALEEWLKHYVFGELDETGILAEYRKEALSKLPT